MIFTGAPATLHDHDALISLPTGPAAFYFRVDRSAPCRPDWYYGLQLVLLARRTGLLSILAFGLYYSSVRCTPEHIMDGTVLDDETIVSLAIQDQLACFVGYRAMLDAQADTTYAWLHDDNFGAAHCTTPGRCKTTRQRYIIDKFTHKQRVTGLRPWIDIGPLRLCVECNKDAQVAHEAGQAEFWDKIPGLFGLPPWT